MFDQMTKSRGRKCAPLRPPPDAHASSSQQIHQSILIPFYVNANLVPSLINPNDLGHSLVTQLELQQSTSSWLHVKWVITSNNLFWHPDLKLNLFKNCQIGGANCHRGEANCHRRTNCQIQILIPEASYQRRIKLPHRRSKLPDRRSKLTEEEQTTT